MRRFHPSPARLQPTAFTLIELLVVIAIIGILTGVALPIVGSIQNTGKKTQSLSNMKQLGTAMLLYCGEHDGKLPGEGEDAPTWSKVANAESDTNNQAWYNVLPRLGGFPAAADFANDKAGFYSKRNLLYVPAAAYPASKLNAPLFAVSLCSKLMSKETTLETLRLHNFPQPARTVLFQESGLPGEKKIVNAQTSYNGQTKSFASRSVARYAGKTVVICADGHADSLAGTDIVATSGKAYYPQSLGRVNWTVDPAANAND